MSACFTVWRRSSWCWTFLESVILTKWLIIFHLYPHEHGAGFPPQNHGWPSHLQKLTVLYCNDSVHCMQLWDNLLLTVEDFSRLAVNSLCPSSSNHNRLPLLPHQFAIKCHAGIHRKISGKGHFLYQDEYDGEARAHNPPIERILQTVWNQGRQWDLCLCATQPAAWISRI